MFGFEERNLASETRAERTIDVRDVSAKTEWFPSLECGQSGLDPGVVGRLVLLGAIVSAALPTRRATGFGRDYCAREHWLQIKARVESDLFQEIGATRCSSE